jgi:hypothetical protein
LVNVRYEVQVPMTRDKCSASSSPIFIKDHVTMLPFIFKRELCELR